MDIQQRVLELISQNNVDSNDEKQEQIQQRAIEIVKERQNEIEEKKIVENITEEEKTESQDLTNDVKEIIKTEYERNLQEQKNSEEITQATKQVTERKIKAELVKDMLVVMNEEQKNELAQYYLECEKKTLAYRKRKEKKIIIEEVSAEIQKRKFNALWLRYGYMYADQKSFVPNKLHNIGKEISIWWNGASDNFKRVVKGTIKLVFWGVVIYLFFKYGIKILQLIPENFNIGT